MARLTPEQKAELKRWRTLISPYVQAVLMTKANRTCRSPNEKSVRKQFC